jgi:hypothetical protein
MSPVAASTPPAAGASSLARVSAMSEGYSIEIADQLVGVVVRGADERVFRFRSAVGEFKALDGHRFARPEAAERAARDHAAHRRREPS